MCLFISLTLFFFLPYIRSVIFQPVYWIFQSYFQFHYFLLLTVFSHCFLCSNRTSIMCCVIFQDNKLRFLEACSAGISHLAVNQEPFNSTAHNRAAKAIYSGNTPSFGLQFKHRNHLDLSLNCSCIGFSPCVPLLHNQRVSEIHVAVSISSRGCPTSQEAKSHNVLWC